MAERELVKVVDQATKFIGWVILVGAALVLVVLPLGNKWVEVVKETYIHESPKPYIQVISCDVHQANDASTGTIRYNMWSTHGR